MSQRCLRYSETLVRFAFAEEKVATYLARAQSMATTHHPDHQVWMDVIELVKNRRS